MATALYDQEFLARDGNIVRLRLTITHPDESRFGTDRLFAWKLLSDWVSPPEDEPDEAMARRYIRRVELSPPQNAKLLETCPGHIRVARKGRKNPSVEYRIEVSDAALIADIQAGDRDETTHFVEVDRFLPDEPAPAPAPTEKPAAKKRKEPPPPPVRTFRDFQDALVGWGAASDPERLIPVMVSWAQEADDERLLGWLERMENRGFRARAAGLLAVVRAQTGRSPERFMAFADAAKPDEQDRRAYADAVKGLIPAWWRVGRHEEAEAAWRWLEEHHQVWRIPGDDAVAELANAAALGGRHERVLALVPRLRADEPRAFAAGLAALIIDGAEAVYTDVLRRWEGVGQRQPPSFDLCALIFNRLHALGRAALCLDLATRFPRVLGLCTQAALIETARVSPADALVAARRILADRRPFYDPVPALALALVAADSPAEAEAWLRDDPSAIAARDSERHLIYLAALGRNEEIRPYLTKLEQTTDLWEFRRTGYGASLSLVPILTTDRSLAVDALRGLVLHPLFENELASSSPSPFTWLADLGEHAFVEERLTAWLLRIEALPPKARDLRCRELARHAAAAGRTDLARAAAALPGKSVRYCSALDWALGSVNVGDWSGAMAALDTAPGHASSIAFSMADAAERAGCYGPRASPLRVSR